MRYKILILAFFYCLAGYSQNRVTVNGTVYTNTGQPIEGATVTAGGESKGLLTNSNGEFSIKINPGQALIISHAEYKTVAIAYDSLKHQPLKIILEPAILSLQNAIVYSGYEAIDQQTASGSYSKIDSSLFNRSTGSTVFSRLEWITPSLYFDHREGSDAPVQIRGISSVGIASTMPLVILDNFPYEGDINNIDPDIVESVTVLKDAAAASIWGAKAGNGVIVITTKKGKINEGMRVQFNSKISVTQKPDLLSERIMTTSDNINVEEFLFQKGYYNSNIRNTRNYPPLSPVVDILVKEQKGIISHDEAEKEINLLRGNDIRNEFEKYLYRKGVEQQYNVNVNGGNRTYKYYLSGGYDKNLSVLEGNKNERYTFYLSNTYLPTKNIDIDLSIGYTKINTTFNNPGEYGTIKNKNGAPLFPYLKFMDESGRPIPISFWYSQTFTDTAGQGKLLDWSYNPINQLKSVDKISISDALIAKAGIKYKFFKSLSAEVKYQYQLNHIGSSSLYSVNSFEARNLINQFTQINGPDVWYILPYGGILDAGQNEIRGYSLRGQINFNKAISQGILNTIAGAEIRENNTKGSYSRTYGYDNNLNFTKVDYVNTYPTFDNVLGDAMIPSSDGFSKLSDRFVSVYFNTAYLYKGKYTLSGSFRKDASNLFGVNINQKWIPLWSLGGAWNISKEKFFKINFIKLLKLRATYGYSGNVSNSVSALTTLGRNPASWQPVTNLPYAEVINYPNPNLKWERVGMMNIGLDFISGNDRISGSVEYYKKRSTDVLGIETMDPTQGALFVTTNSAEISGHGFDIMINSRNIIRPHFMWETQFLLSIVKSKVTK